MNEQELQLIEKLGECFTEFVKLPYNTHPTDHTEFCQHVHILQRHVMARAAQRLHPEIGNIL